MLDFTRLSDDELLELIRQATMSAIDRGLRRHIDALKTSAQDEAQIKFEAARQAQEKLEKQRIEQLKKEAEEEVLKQHRKADGLSAEQQVQRNWARKASILKATKELLPWLVEEDGTFSFSLNLWNRNNADYRLYIQEFPNSKKGWEIVVYLSGNRYQPPGTVTGTSKESIPDVTALAKTIRELYSSLSFNTSEIKSSLEPDAEFYEKFVSKFNKQLEKEKEKKDV